MSLHIGSKNDEATSVAFLKNAPKLLRTYSAWHPKALIQVRNHRGVVLPGVG